MTTAAIITLAITGTAISAYGMYQQGRMAEQQAKQEAAWHQYNALIAKREAEAERQAVAFEAQQQKRKAKQLFARQRALIGAAGVTVEGSPLLVMEDTAAQLALENINIRMRGARRVSAYESRSILDISKASAARSVAGGYRRAGAWGAGASILTGAAQTGYMGYQTGMWGGGGGGSYAATRTTWGTGIRRA